MHRIKAICGYPSHVEIPLSVFFGIPVSPQQLEKIFQPHNRISSTNIRLWQCLLSCLCYYRLMDKSLLRYNVLAYLEHRPICSLAAVIAFFSRRSCITVEVATQLVGPNRQFGRLHVGEELDDNESQRVATVAGCQSA